jgi:hypothetical protein
MATKLTKTQKELLTLLKTEGEPGRYTELNSREHRTARSLERKGLVKLQTWGSPETEVMLAAMLVTPEETLSPPKPTKVKGLTKAQKKLYEEVRADEAVDSVPRGSWISVESYREVQTALALQRKGHFEVDLVDSSHARVRTCGVVR